MFKAIIIYGPPGSGKGTQSELLVKKFGLINFDTGSHIRSIIYDPAKQKSKAIQREKKINEAGVLNTPSWVLEIVKNGVERIAGAGYGVVFSGSPRTPYEAFGDKKSEGLISFLGKKYGSKNIVTFEIIIPDKSSADRNASRLTCPLCHLTVLGKYYADAKFCPFCGMGLIKRKDDAPRVFSKRLEEYRTRTKPIFVEMRRRGIKIHKIDGTPMPAGVFAQISKRLK